MTPPCDGDDGGVPGQSWCYIEKDDTGSRQTWNPTSIGAKEDIGFSTEHYWHGSCNDGSELRLNMSYMNTEPGFDFVLVCESAARASLLSVASFASHVGGRTGV
jgi:hypothetical protein